MSWYETWFDSPYYPILYRHRDTEEADKFIRNIVNFLQIREGAKVLDMGCGRGRHAQKLHDLGFEVIGIDLSETSISEAKALQLPQAQFFLQDMREPVQLRYFDAIFNLFSSFGYFDDPADDQKVIQAVQQQLKPGGYVIFDFLNAVKVRSQLVTESIERRDDITFYISRKIVDDCVVKNIHFRINDISYDYQEKVRLYTLQDFMNMFDEAGLSIHQTFGNYILEPFLEQTSDRLILIGMLK